MHTDSVKCHGLRNGCIHIDSISGGFSPYYFSLHPDKGFSTKRKFDILFSGQYTVYVRDANGCTFSQNIDVFQPDTLSVKIIPSENQVDIGTEIQLRGEVYPDYTPLKRISWRPTEYFEPASGLNQKARVLDDTNFALDIETDKGCTAVDRVQVKINKAKIYIPNIIQTGSNQNAFLTVYGGTEVQEVASLRVFNRWGALLFERLKFPPNDPSFGWNGKFKNTQLPPGVYTYQAIITLISGKKEVKSGTVAVVRQRD